MPEYLCEGGSVSCGGPRCLSILEERQKKAARKEALEGLKDESLDYLKNLYFSSEIIENSSSSSKETPVSQEKEAQEMAQDKALEEKNNETGNSATPSLSGQKSADKKKGLLTDIVNGEIEYAKKQQAFVEKKVNEFIGETKEVFLINQQNFKEGMAKPEQLTLGVCLMAATEKGANLEHDAMCVSGIAYSMGGEALANKWKSHCNTLPSSPDINKNSSNN